MPDTSPAPPDLPAVFELLRRFAAYHYAGHSGVRIVIDLPDGRTAKFPVPACGPCPPHAAEPSDSDDVLNQLERDVAQVVDALPAGGTLTGEQVAEQAGYPYNGRFKDTLARLVRAGRIRNLRPGYARRDG